MSETDWAITFIAIGFMVLLIAILIACFDREGHRKQMLDSKPCNLERGHTVPHNGVPRLSEADEVLPRRARPGSDRAHHDRVKRIVSRETWRKQ